MPSSVTMETWQMFISLAGLLLAFIGSAAGMGKFIISRTDQGLALRFEALEKIRAKDAKNLEIQFTALLDRYKEDAKAVQELEKDFLKFKAALPLDYVRREDYVRNQTIIEAKLDALALKIENLQLKGQREC